jgi:hypothetical protein
VRANKHRTAALIISFTVASNNSQPIFKPRNRDWRNPMLTLNGSGVHCIGKTARSCSYQDMTDTRRDKRTRFPGVCVSSMTKIRTLLVCTLFVIALATAASAGTTYASTGNPFDPGTACPRLRSISGSFSVAQPLRGDLSFLTFQFPFPVADGGTLSEPSSLLLLGTILLGVMVAWRRKRLE